MDGEIRRLGPKDKPRPGDFACGSCGMPVRLSAPEPARLCCKKIWHLAGGGRPNA